VDQRQALDYALEAAEGAVAELDQLVGTDIPAAYQAAGKTWRNAVKEVGKP
jgi:hypothetical protein